MVENTTEPPVETTEAPEEPLVESAEPQKGEEEGGLLPEEPETETEIEDEEKMEQPENQFDELDEDLTDLEDSTDTIWLLRRVVLGIIKTLFVLAGLGLLGWLIWGGVDEKPGVKRVATPAPAVEREVKKEKSLKNTILERLKEEKEKVKLFEKPEAKEVLVPAVSPQQVVAQTSPVGRAATTWNYWMETQRMGAQRGTPADVLRWKKDVETLFEIPFPQQINGSNYIARDHQIGQILQTIATFLSRGQALQTKLSQEIGELNARSSASKSISLAAEQEFVNALKQSNPVGISRILDRKIAAERDVQKYAIDAEARSIFAHKISEYALVLENVQTVMTANRAAIAQDIQVVAFPADPFGRVLSPQSWSPQGGH